MRKELRPVHDEVSCDLCHRTILKGERIEAFVVGGDRQQVCELCSFRAVRAGWLRESELEQHPLDPERAGPRRTLWSRALQWVEDQGLWGAPADSRDGAREAPASSHEESSGSSRRRQGADLAVEAPSSRRHARATAAHDGTEPGRRHVGLGEAAGDGAESGADGVDEAYAWARRPARTPNAAVLKDLIAGRRRESHDVHAVPTSREGKIERALELFNASEHRRTIAGVGRALGEPWVTATPLGDEPTAHEVGLVVAWELSWYRYRVDLDDADQAVLLLDRGDEVAELGEDLRPWNVAADADGRLALTVEAVS
jgi:hypothetical protein